MNIIEADRLLLRSWEPQDLEPFSKINADPRVMEHMLKTLTLEETQAFINRINDQFANHGYGLFATVLKNSNEFIGFVGLSIPSFATHFTPCVEIGWRLAYPHWGKGYATEAAKEILKLAFVEYGLPEILSWTTTNNLRSRRVMEKLHMTHNPADNFTHPNLPLDHPSSSHVLYRIKQKKWLLKEIN